MSNIALKTFKWVEHEVRTVSQDGELLFCLADLCNALEYKNHRDILVKMVDERHMVREVLTENNRRATFLKEAGMWRLVMRSNKTIAKGLQRWLEDIVLPSLRQHGGFHTDEEVQRLLVEVANKEDMITALERSINNLRIHTRAQAVANTNLADHQLGSLLLSKMDLQTVDKRAWWSLGNGLAADGCITKVVRPYPKPDKFIVVDELRARTLIETSFRYLVKPL